MDERKPRRYTLQPSEEWSIPAPHPVNSRRPGRLDGDLHGVHREDGRMTHAETFRNDAYWAMLGVFLAAAVFAGLWMFLNY
jgi:hypothetical protein